MSNDIMFSFNNNGEVKVMSKNIMIDRQLFDLIFDYFSEHEKDLPKDPKLPAIKAGLADKYIRNANREIYSNKILKGLDDQSGS